MNQSVIAFASEAARNAALTAPLEGQLVWLEDSNKYVYYSGSAWVDLLVPASSGNAIINGAMEIWQRGTTLTRSGAGNTADYLADRFRTDRETSGVVISQQAFTPGTAPVAGYESSFFLRNVVTSVAGSGNYVLIQQPIEDVRTFAGQTVTLSFWAKADAAKSVAVEIAQVFGSGGSSSVNTAGGKIALTTSWARYSATVAVPSVSGKTIGTGSNLSVRIWLEAGSTFDSRTGTLGQQSGTFDIWGVQLESGSSATPFRRNANSIQGELAACQRYYWNIARGNSFALANSFMYNTTTAAGSAFPPVAMRATPTLEQTTGTNFYTNIVNNGSDTFDSFTEIGSTSQNVINLVASSGISGTTGHAGQFRTNNASASIALNAEL
jgi:hypothetical protein